MINLLLLGWVRSLLWLRYRVEVTGLKEIAKRGRTGVLFLPTHPAMIDPIMVMAWLFRLFKARALADSDQIDRFFIRWLAKRAGVLAITDIAKAGGTANGAKEAIDQCIDALRNGDNLILYPGGRLKRQHFEDLRGNSGVKRILEALPDVRVVVVRTQGLWGSSFSWAHGTNPNVGRTLKHGLGGLLLSGTFFAPRRHVTMELIEAEDFPRQGTRNDINRHLEAVLNRGAPLNTYVPYSIWERGGTRVLPEPEAVGGHGDPSQVPDAIREQVTRFIADLMGTEDFTDETRLAHDLGMDSLSLMEAAVWLQSEFGRSPGRASALQTVGDVMLAASGRAVSTSSENLRAVPAKWFDRLPKPSRPEDLQGMTVPQAFLAQLLNTPNASAVADQISGVLSYRDLGRAMYVLSKKFEALPGQNVGIMFPASVAAATMYLATLFAGKTPAMINWTLGPKNLAHCVDVAGIEAILTSRVLVDRLENQGVSFGDIRDLFVYVEDVRSSVTRWDKYGALLANRNRWAPLRDRAEKASPTAVILFTSGSESVPKAVPLTHENMLTNVTDTFDCFGIGRHDSLLGMLPPFHSFGLTASVVLPLALGVRVAYSPDPTDGATLAAIIAAYQCSLLPGAPTFLEGIAGAGTGDELQTMRIIISGAERCQHRVYETLQARCPDAIVLEGYGATECSPVIAVNRENDPRPYTIGKILRTVTHAIVDPETHHRVALGDRGLLLVRGPSIFGGYLGDDVPSPFVMCEGEQWYNTGDLVSEDADGYLTFAGRLKRFIKLGGEMISLPAIEAALEGAFVGDEDEGPVLAVSPAGNADNAEVVLFTAKPIEREAANRVIREAGLSGLHNIRRVVRVDELPLLGSGKVDYRALDRQLSTNQTDS